MQAETSAAARVMADVVSSLDGWKSRRKSDGCARTTKARLRLQAALVIMLAE
jgi:hypothetical protein